MYFAVRPGRARMALLAIASLLFYSYGDLAGIPVLFGVILIAFAGGLAIGRWPRWAFVTAVIGVSALVAELAFFKYGAYAGQQLGGPAWSASILPPLGVSFFTFEAIAYLIDRRRGTAPTERSLLDLSLYVMVFPHLISGPILRANEILPQLRRTAALRRATFVSGLQLFIEGLAKKKLLADPAGSIADRVFASPASFDTASAWVGVLAYTLQIYGDFAGYTDMGRGIARMIGIELPLNFDLPYSATSLRDFWRRWHITLSRWLRDYLYIPLGGSRRGRPRMAVSVVLTMTIGGMWHGSGPTFALWGAYHGALLAFQRIAPTSWRLPAPVAWLLTLFLVVNGWALFRSQDLQRYAELLAGLYGPREGISIGTRDGLATAVGFLVVVGAMCVGRRFPARIGALRSSPVAGAAAYGIAAGLALLVILGSPTDARSFIYFRF